MISLLRKRCVERNSVTEKQAWCRQNEKRTKNLSLKKEATILQWIRATSRSEHGQYTLYKGHSVEQGNSVSSVGIGTRLWAKWPTNWTGANIFFSLHGVHTGSGGWVILKWKPVRAVWAGLNWLRSGSNGEFLHGLQRLRIREVPFPRPRCLQGAQSSKQAT